MAEETESKQLDKAEAEKPKPKKPPGYRKFQSLLEQVIKAPPMRKKGGNGGTATRRFYTDLHYSLPQQYLWVDSGSGRRPSV
jgi:hypothetical protein